MFKKSIVFFLLGTVLCYPLIGAESDFSSKIIGVGVIVTDLEKSLAFYKEVIGMIQEENGSFDVNAEFSKKSGLSNGVPFHVEVLKLGYGENASQWKLMTFGDVSKKQKSDFIQDHTGMQYITVLVNDLSPILERIRRAKVKLLGETPVKLGEENYFVLVQDPDGTFVELIGPMK